MERAFREVSVKQVHVISDGVTYKRGCFQGTCGDAVLIFKAKNDSRDPKSLIVNSYSLDEDFVLEIIHGIDIRLLILVGWVVLADSCKVIQ